MNNFIAIHLFIYLFIYLFRNLYLFIYFKINLFIYFWLRWVLVAARGLSLVATSRGYSSLRCSGFSLRWLLLLQSMGSRHAGFSSCGTRAQQLWHTGLAAPRHVGSSQTRDRTHIPCTGRWILNHCTTREVPITIHLEMQILWTNFQKNTPYQTV